MAEHNDLGRWGEKMAIIYLRNEGYEIMALDWHYGHRDIDIIALDGTTLVFVEVKTRRDENFTDAVAAVDWKKQRNLCIAMNIFLKKKRWDGHSRFDVITVIGTSATDCRINHIRNFQIAIH